MKKYIIEREIPSVGEIQGKELKGACQKSNDTLAGMAGKAQWQQSYLTQDKLYCVYLAQNEEAVKEHARISGFPATKIHEVKTVLDPVSAG